MPKNSFFKKWPAMPGASWLTWVLCFFGIDRMSKSWAFHHVMPGEIMPVFPGLNWVVVWNEGVAFSWLSHLSQGGQWILQALIILMTLAMMVCLLKTPKDMREVGFALSAICGGALGNVWDRLSYGRVLDFIDCYWGYWHWYTFNVADAFIVVGTAFLLKASFREKKESVACP